MKTLCTPSQGSFPYSAPNRDIAFAGVDVVIVPDRDAAGDRGASKTGSVLFGVASSVRVAALPAEFRKSKGDDVRDVLRLEGGRELVLNAIEDARPWEPPSDEKDVIDDRPGIEVTPDEHIVNDQAVKALARDKTLFQRGDMLVHILHDHSTKTLKGITRPAHAPHNIAGELGSPSLAGRKATRAPIPREQVATPASSSC